MSERLRPNDDHGRKPREVEKKRVVEKIGWSFLAPARKAELYLASQSLYEELKCAYAAGWDGQLEYTREVTLVDGRMWGDLSPLERARIFHEQRGLYETMKREDEEGRSFASSPNVHLLFTVDARGNHHAERGVAIRTGAIHFEDGKAAEISAESDAC